MTRLLGVGGCVPEVLKTVDIHHSFLCAVETPGWRINVLTNRYQLEGTEVSISHS